MEEAPKQEALQSVAQPAVSPRQGFRFSLQDLVREITFEQYFDRVIKGLKQPKDSGEYKFAIFQVQRLWGPFAGVVFPFFVALLLAMQGERVPLDVRPVQITIVQPANVKEVLDIKPVIAKPPDVPEPTEVVVSDGPSDMPGPPGDPGPFVGQGTEFSPKPSEFDTVAMVRSPIVMKGIYSSRNPGARGSLLAGYGGGSATEHAVMLALRWLKKYQEADGKWATSSGGGRPEHELASPAMTGLALLAYLAHGETPASQEFGLTVERALRWLIENQTSDGRFKESDSHEYSLPIAAYAVSEGYALTKVPMLKDAAEKAIAVIVNGQQPSGMWSYRCTADNRNDMSYSGWCVQALKAALMAELNVPGAKDAMQKAMQGFKLNYAGGGFGYIGPSKTMSMTGVAVLCMQLAGAGRDPAATAALPFLETATCDWQNPVLADPLYSWYYITQARFHAGKETWSGWNKQFSRTLVKSQMVVSNAIEDAHGRLVDIGYWNRCTSGEHCRSFVYNTTLSTLMLTVYYRYLPTYKQPEEVAPDAGAAADKDIEVGIKK